ncbi:MAG: ATP-dependent 6-phosphofructokinase [Spirochaetaceae bacterium]|nr:ATP-dependent 6-phosphofructokinase [Spirochaetaceae bacterium]
MKAKLPPQNANNSVNFKIESLGKATYDSPFTYADNKDDYSANFVSEKDQTLYNTFLFEDSTRDDSQILNEDNRMERAGPREKLFFKPEQVTAGICTCGGLCPGLNNVIRALVRNLMLGYHVRKVWGFQFGYRGLVPDAPEPPISLDPDLVDDIQAKGGTILGSARGSGERTAEIVDTLIHYRINILFVIGGDGSQKGALAINNEAKKRGYKLAVVGIPKTIDNDFSFISRSFGFETAVGRAVEAVNAAHVEAKGAYNGVGLVKVMGRDSGFIAAQTALASQEANFVLVPEVPFDLDGPNGLLKQIEKRLSRKNHLVIIIAEGAGEELMSRELGIIEATDAGGNKIMHDIGIFLRSKIVAYLKNLGLESSVRYIDPSYMIRASAANSNDSIFCARLGANAVHAAMAGKTGMLVSQWNGVYVHVPIELATRKRAQINPQSSLWRDVIESTLQPITMLNEVK